MAEVTMVKALNEALRRSLAEDPRALVLGEDVGKLGGVFRVTDGLQGEFGTERVFDTPLAEAAIAGISVGMALAGWHPIAEMQFDGFSYPALDQVISHVAKYRYRSRGRQPVPMVIRIPFAGGIGAAEHHSESPEAYYAHTAGLKVVVPSTPADAKGLLLSAIRDDDLVMFSENKVLYGSKGEVPEGDEGIPLGVADIKRKGDDVTIVAISRMVHQALAAADALSAEGIEAEVIDPRTLSPLDDETILSSVAKTHRLVIVDEDNPRCSAATDIAAMVADEGFDTLDAPIKRVTAPHTPVPFSPPLEQFYIPSPDRIADAVREIV